MGCSELFRSYFKWQTFCSLDLKDMYRRIKKVGATAILERENIGDKDDT